MKINLGGLCIFLIILGLVAPIASCGEGDSEDLSWHDKYVLDNCARCPECCTTSTSLNIVADQDEGLICFSDNFDLSLAGWTDGEIYQWCKTGIGPMDIDTYK